MARFEPVRTQTFPYSQDLSTRASSYEGPDDNHAVYNGRSHPGGFRELSRHDAQSGELEAGTVSRGHLTADDHLVPPPTAASEDSRVTLFYHGYTTDENRHWIDEEALSSGDETARNDRDDGFTDATPMVPEAAAPAGSPSDDKPEAEKDPNLITWTGPDDPLHPHNWPAYRRRTSTILIAMFAFIAPMASTMLAPALHEIRDDLDVETDVEEFLLFSIFLLAFAM